MRGTRHICGRGRTIANFEATGRTNYFKVKDEAAFKDWAEKYGLVAYPEEETEDSDGHKFTITTENRDHGTWPGHDEENDIEVDIIEMIAEHLADDEVCVIMEAGAEKLRYVSAWAAAFDNKGEVVELKLGDIYGIAKEKWGRDIPTAEY